MARKDLTIAHLEQLFDVYVASPLATEIGIGYDDGACPIGESARRFCGCAVCHAERGLSAHRIGVVLALRAYRAARTHLLASQPLPGADRARACINLVEVATTQMHWLAPSPPTLSYQTEVAAELRRHRRAAVAEAVAATAGAHDLRF